MAVSISSHTLTFNEVSTAHRKRHAAFMDGCLLCRGIKERKSLKFLECVDTYACFISGWRKRRWSVSVDPYEKEAILNKISSCGIYVREIGETRKYIEGL